MSTPHPIGKDELRRCFINGLSHIQVKAVKAQGGTTITSDEEALVERIADELMQSVDAYIIEAEKRAELRGRIDELEKVIKYLPKCPYTPRNNFVSSKPEHTEIAKRDLSSIDLFDWLTFQIREMSDLTTEGDT